MPNPGNLVHQTATSTGTGNFTLTKVNGKNDFATAFTTGGSSVFHYFISNQGAAEWEIGLGSAPTTNTLSRDDVLFNSLGSTAKIDFTAGTKDVTNDIPALNQVMGTTVASSGHAVIYVTTRGNEIKSAGFAPQAAITPGTGLSFSGTTLNVALTSGNGITVSGATISVALTSGQGITVAGATISAVTASTTQIGIVRLADAGRLRANTTGYVADVDSIWGAAAAVALSTGTTAVTVDMSSFLTLATLSMATNHTLSNPTSPKVGQHFIIRGLSADTSAHVLALGTNYKLLTGVEVGPYTISTVEKLYVAGFVESSTGIIVTSVGRTTALT